MEEIQISIEVIKNIFTQIFREQYQKQESLFKLHKETILPIISFNTKLTTQQLDKFNVKRRKSQQKRKTGTGREEN